MSYATSADLLQLFRDEAGRPSTDEFLTDATAYRYLTVAQGKVIAALAPHIGRSMVNDPTLMTTLDSGATYVFGTDWNSQYITPIGATEIYGRIGGRELYADMQDRRAGGDFVYEGNRIRIPNGRTQTFSAGPYWRGVVPNGVINGGTNPILRPLEARPLIVYQALIDFGARGNRMDTSSWREQYDRLFQDILRAHKTALNTQTLAGRGWWQSWFGNGGLTAAALTAFSFALFLADGSRIADGLATAGIG